MRLAVIDCGTNTFNLVIVELSDKPGYKRVFSTRIPVKLGENTINEGFIADIPFNRGIQAITSFKHTCDEYEVNNILAFATSAIRDAANGKQFVDEVKKHCQVDISVIDGNREAELIYFGVKEAVELGNETSLIMDIGGGSNEFILANKKQLLWKQSFNIGAARLLEKFKQSDPISKTEIQSITDYLTGQLLPLTEAVNLYKPVELIGSSGAFESFIEMIHGELGGEALSMDKTEYELNLQAQSKISQLVKTSTREERKRIKGLLPMRFDMIVISCIMVDFILDTYGLKKTRVSTYSLKEGAITDYIHTLEQ